jgi:hypothetical protein
MLQLFRCLKTRIGAIADGTPCQIISRQAKARKFVQSFANFVHSARVAHIVLRQSARKSPHRAFNWRAADSEDLGVLRLDRFGKHVVGGRHPATSAGAHKTRHQHGPLGCVGRK